jgi:hypothetical protein
MKKNYDNDYFFISKPETNKTLPFLVPDKNTENINFDFEVLPFGSPPLVFHNGWKKEYKERGITTTCPDILFAGADLVVRSPIREKLLALNLPNVHLQPTVYIDDRDEWHEDYWYLTFPERLDCWDRDTSDYEQEIEPIRLGGFELYQVYAYSLDGQLLDAIPAPKRMLFKMGGTLSADILCHTSLLSIFSGGGKSGAQLTPVPEF